MQGSCWESQVEAFLTGKIEPQTFVNEAFLLHGADLKAYAIKEVGKQDAEDVTAEAIKRLLQEVDTLTYDQLSHIQGWLKITAKNIIKSEKRQRIRDRKLVEKLKERQAERTFGPIIPIDEMQEFAEHLRKALLKIPLKERKVIIDRLEEDPFSVVAEDTGLAESSARVYVIRAGLKIYEYFCRFTEYPPKYVYHQFIHLLTYNQELWLKIKGEVLK